MNCVPMLVLAKAFPPNLGGVETYSHQVALAYARAGFSPTVLTQFSGPAADTEQPATDCPVELINVGAGSQPAVFARMLARLARRRSDPFAFVHATTWRVALPALMLGIGPVFITVHGREVTQTPAALRPLMRSVLRRAARVLLISDYSLKVCSEVAPEIAPRAVVAWNGITWPHEAPRPPQPGARPFRILTACQLTQRKNVGAAIAAVDELRRRGVGPVHLRIAGDGPEKQRLRAQVAELKLEREVEFLGMVPRASMPALYRGADLFLHPQSHSHDKRDFESFCIAVADAMALAVPTIAGRDGAPAEYIQHGINGWLVDGADATGIADTIAAAIENPDLAGIGARARRLALAEFSWDKHVAALHQSTTPAAECASA